jgi:hypothetical protein
VTSYIKKQLAEIALPSAPRLGLNIKQSFKGVLSDPESRDRWVSRFTYWSVCRTRHRLCADPDSTVSSYFDRSMLTVLSTVARFFYG